MRERWREIEREREKGREREREDKERNAYAREISMYMASIGRCSRCWNT